RPFAPRYRRDALECRRRDRAVPWPHIASPGPIVVFVSRRREMVAFASRNFGRRRRGIRSPNNAARTRPDAYYAPGCKRPSDFAFVGLGRAHPRRIRLPITAALELVAGTERAETGSEFSFTPRIASESSHC